MNEPVPSATAAWQAVVLTLFPEQFPGPLAASLVGRALNEQIWRLETLNFRDFSTDRGGRVDDEPFGGGPGMVLRPDIVDATVRSAVSKIADAQPGQALTVADSPADSGSGTVDRPLPILYLSPRGRPLDQAYVRELAEGPGAILVCGRYEGIDQRVVDAWQMEEVSIGDYILSGGEIAAMVLLDSVVRTLPGVIGAAASLEEESFETGLLEYPHFTRPDTWTDSDGVVRAVPEILTSGHHGAIADWRQQMAEETTRQRRPDIWSRYQKEQHRSD